MFTLSQNGYGALIGMLYTTFAFRPCISQNAASKKASGNALARRFTLSQNGYGR